MSFCKGIKEQYFLVLMIENQKKLQIIIYCLHFIAYLMALAELHVHGFEIGSKGEKEQRIYLLKISYTQVASRIRSAPTIV